MKMSYSKSGVDYKLLDPAKRMAQDAGLQTKKILEGSEFSEVTQSRGETAYVIEGVDSYYAIVQEGLGTKNLVADEVRKITGKTYYDSIAYDTVAAIINDLITVGAKPISVLAYWAVGDSKWMKDEVRMKDLVNGWKRACIDSRATWGGGETPCLNDVLYPGVINLAGSAIGVISPKKRLIMGDRIEKGDAIIIFESSGIHANGLSLARKILDKTESGYSTRLSDGSLYGEALLIPAIIYANLIREILDNKVDIHYMINVTGHGFRKFMRAVQQFSYILDIVPPVSHLFQFIQHYSGLTDYDMYGTFNMGAGFAVIVPEKDTAKVLSVSKKNNIKTIVAGHVEKGEKKVIINPLHITYKGNELEIR